MAVSRDPLFGLRNTGEAPERIDLAAAAELVQLPGSLHFQRRANAWREAISKAAHAAGLLPIPCAGAALDPLDCCRAELNIRNGRQLSNLRILQTLGAAQAPRELIIPDQILGWEIAHLWERAGESVSHLRLSRPLPFRRWWISAKRAVQNFRMRLPARRSMAELAASGPASAEILCVTRTRNHVIDMLPSVRWLQENYGWNGVFAVEDMPTQDWLRTKGLFAVPISSTAVPRPRATRGAVHRQVQNFKEFLRVGDFVPEGIDPLEHRVLSEETLRILPRYEENVHAVAEEVRFLIERFKVQVTLVGNPYTTEGRTAAHVANALGVGTAALEHGSIFPNDPMWDDCPVDLLCVWGEPSRRALLQSGVPAERIVVTGAPRFDEVFRNAAQNTSPANRPAQILVATSGPGDIVSLAQFGGFIRMLYGAADLTPEIHWKVKLHPKDRPENYHNARPTGHPRVEIMLSQSKGKHQDILACLSTARALVTISSTSALDAMAVDVPVIAVNVWPRGEGLEDVEFLSPANTIQVRTAQELAAAVRAAVSGEIPPERRAAARAFAAAQFPNRGTAAAAVGHELLQLRETGTKQEQRQGALGDHHQRGES